MPKQLLKIDRFHGGISNHSDPRDIEDICNVHSYKADTATLGVLKVMNVVASHEVPNHDHGVNSGNTAYTDTTKISAGYGAFPFSHDKAGFGEGDLWSVHTSGSSEQIHTNSAAHWTPGQLVGCRLRNVSDTDGNPNGSSGTITANTNTTITVANSLSITAVANNGSGKIQCTCVDHGWVSGNTVTLSGMSVGAYDQASVVLTRIDNDTFDINAITYSANATGTVTGGLHNPREAGGGTALNTFETNDNIIIDKFPDRKSHYIILANCKDLGTVHDQRAHVYHYTGNEWADGLRLGSNDGFRKPLFWQADGRLFIQETDTTVDVSSTEVERSTWARDNHLTVGYVKYTAGGRDDGTMFAWDSWVTYRVQNSKRAPVYSKNTLREISQHGLGPNTFHATYWDEGGVDNELGGNTLINIGAGSAGGTWTADRYFNTGKKDSDADSGEKSNYYTLYITDVNQWGEESQMEEIGTQYASFSITAAASGAGGASYTKLTCTGHTFNNGDKSNWN